MSDQTQRGTPDPMLDPRHTAGLPAWGVAVAACGLVITANLLGVSWLRETVLGLPAGLWFIGLIVCLGSASVRGRLAAVVSSLWGAIDQRPAATEFARESQRSPMGWWPRGRVASVCLDGLSRVGAALVRLAWLPVWGGEVSVAGDARQRFEDWIEGLSLPTRPLRVGLCMPDEEAEALVATSGSARVEWYRLASWEDPQSACRRHLFDAAVFHDGEGPVRLVTLERPGRPAGIVEWADLAGELNFGKLFPSRVDPAAVVIEGATRSRVREGAGLLRALVEAAATLARSEQRLELADRVLGRRPTDEVDQPEGPSLWRAPRSPGALVMAGLARESAQHADAWPEAASIAADASSAYFINADGLNPSERRESLLVAGNSAAAGATSALRLGAACIGALEDEEGMGWLVRADAMIREGAATLATLDHAAFLESELVHGPDDPMSVGRAAAGICMVCAAAEPERISFVRDDMLEEMAYAGWLIGRDQDRALLIRVFLEIEHALGFRPAEDIEPIATLRLRSDCEPEPQAESASPERKPTRRAARAGKKTTSPKRSAKKPAARKKPAKKTARKPASTAKKSAAKKSARKKTAKQTSKKTTAKRSKSSAKRSKTASKRASTSTRQAKKSSSKRSTGSRSTRSRRAA